MRYLQEKVFEQAALTASADITPLDLPVNPLSLLYLRFSVANANPAAIGTYSLLDDLLGMITAIRIAHKGEDIVNGSLADIAALNMAAFGLHPWINRSPITSAANRDTIFPICLGRGKFNPKSCFPATTRGNLRFFMTAGAAPTGFATLQWALEAVQLIEAEPEDYVKYVTNSRTSVAGQFDAPLNIGNPFLGILLFDTGLRANTTRLTSWGSVKLLKDGVEQYYPNTDIEALAGYLGSGKSTLPLALLNHAHQINDGAALSMSDDANTLTTAWPQGYGYMDFDPEGDGAFQLETAGSADLKLRGLGDEATAVRYLPVERVAIHK